TVRRVAPGRQTASNTGQLLRRRARSLDPILGAFELGRRDHFHGPRDLLGVLDRGNLPSDILKTGHGVRCYTVGLYRCLNSSKTLLSLAVSSSSSFFFATSSLCRSACASSICRIRACSNFRS